MTPLCHNMPHSERLLVVVVAHSILTGVVCLQPTFSSLSTITASALPPMSITNVGMWVNASHVTVCGS